MSRREGDVGGGKESGESSRSGRSSECLKDCKATEGRGSGSEKVWDYERGKKEGAHCSLHTLCAQKRVS